MKIHQKICQAVLGLAFASIACAQTTSGQTDGMHWVATWASAQQQPRVAGPPRAAATPAPNTPPAAAAPARAFTPPPSAFNNQTVRMIARASIGGRRLRVQLSNAFGATPLVVGAAHIAIRGKDSAIVPSSDRVISFNGKPGCTIPARAVMLSDPLDFDVPKLTDLAVSVYVPGDTGPASNHSLGLHTTYISKEGDFTAAPEIADATTSQTWYWLASIDVMAPANAAAIVAFGDSITDGATSTPNTDRSWPSDLAQRLLANPATANIAVINEGISGNRVLGDGAGVSALTRFDRDVLSQSGVKWVMIMEGINDIGLGAGGRGGAAITLTADDLTGAMKQMVERAHTHGIKVIGCTLTPYGGAGYASEAGETIRGALNSFIRTSGTFDAVVDFDKATQDSDNPKQFRTGFNNTDHLHPNDAGYQAMADSIDLSLFVEKKR
jgi:lysophospholipase L1-like esterase